MHRWVGLLLGALLLIQGITGASMVFRNELNRALHREALTVEPAGARMPVQSLAERVRALHPQLTLRRIEYPQAADQAFWFRMEGADGGSIRYVAVDPFRGTVRRDGPLIAWPAHWLFELHQALLLGPAGEYIVGCEAIGLLLLAIVGPILWWPGSRGLRRSFRITLRSGRYRANRDLHRVAGVALAIVLATSALTGMLLVWRTQIQSVVALVAPITKRPAPTVSMRAGKALLPLDTIVDGAREAYGVPVRNVRFPGGNGRVVLVYLQAMGTVRPRATDQIWFDGYTGKVLATYDAMAVSSGTRLLDWTIPVHTGQALGLPGRIVFLLAAIGLQGLVITGFLQWLERRRARLRTRPD